MLLEVLYTPEPNARAGRMKGGKEVGITDGHGNNLHIMPNRGTFRKAKRHNILQMDTIIIC